MNGITLHIHQQIAALAHHRYDTLIEEGGVGSGKSLGDVLVFLDRAQWDTAQWGGLFTQTWPQLQAVTGEIYKHLDAAGVEHVFNCRPPKEWVEEWKAKGIPTPPARDRYTNCFISRSGLHVYFATLLNQNYRQLRGWEFGWIIIEEYTAGPTQAAVEFAMERVRCGKAQFANQFEAWRKKQPNPDAVEYEDWCRVHHRHTKYLKGNPPEDDGHWSFGWLSAMNTFAATLPGGESAKYDDDYSNLLRGIGPVIYIPSSTEDNSKNLSSGYISNQRARLDEETAKRRLGGVRSRRRVGRVYTAFSRDNEYPIKYHRDRTIYVNVDFNNRPIAAGLCHPLKSGEFPSEHDVTGVKHVGKFGEVFDTRGGGLEALCDLLLSGDVGNKGGAPREWKGLLEHAGPVIFFGDGTGLNKSASGKSLWDIVDTVIGRQLKARRIRYSRMVARNELVPIRVRACNAKFCSAAGIRSFWIDPDHCTHSIRDYMNVVWDKRKPDVQKYGDRNGDLFELTHLSDGDGYMHSVLFPLGRESGDGGRGPRGSGFSSEFDDEMVA